VCLYPDAHASFFSSRLLLTAIAGFAIAQTPSGPITFERIQNSNREPQNWLTYSGNNMGQRYSPLTQITLQNARDLEMAWLWQARSIEKFEATSIVVDGILYTVQRRTTSWRSTRRRAGRFGHTRIETWPRRATAADK
jgi:glucose dehydrogenase